MTTVQPMDWVIGITPAVFGRQKTGRLGREEIREKMR